MQSQRSFDKLMEQDVMAYGDLFYSVAETYAAVRESFHTVLQHHYLLRIIAGRFRHGD